MLGGHSLPIKRERRAKREGVSVDGPEVTGGWDRSQFIGGSWGGSVSSASVAGLRFCSSGSVADGDGLILVCRTETGSHTPASQLTGSTAGGGRETDSYLQSAHSLLKGLEGWCFPVGGDTGDQGGGDQGDSGDQGGSPPNVGGHAGEQDPDEHSHLRRSRPDTPHTQRGDLLMFQGPGWIPPKRVGFIHPDKRLLSTVQSDVRPLT